MLDRASHRPPGGRYGEPAQRMTDISKSPTQKAEAKFAVAREKAKAMTAYEKEQREVANRTAKLRALRLAKEAADKLAAEEEAAANPPKAKKAKKATAKKATAEKAPAEKPATRTTRVY